MSLIELAPGHFIDPLALKPQDVSLAEIAWGLSTAPRWYGFTSRVFTVGEHSVYVSKTVERMAREAGDDEQDVIEGALQALLHDATEYIQPDMAYTVKRAPGMEAYARIEDANWLVIAEAFQVSPTMHRFVHEVDKRMATTEKLIFKSDVMPPHWVEYRKQWPEYTGDWDIIDRYPVANEQVRRRFLDRYRELENARQFLASV